MLQRHKLGTFPHKIFTQSLISRGTLLSKIQRRLIMCSLKVIGNLRIYYLPDRKDVHSQNDENWLNTPSYHIIKNNRRVTGIKHCKRPEHVVYFGTSPPPTPPQLTEQPCPPLSVSFISLYGMAGLFTSTRNKGSGVEPNHRHLFLLVFRGGKDQLSTWWKIEINETKK
jgi:hypothetical protein